MTLEPYVKFKFDFRICFYAYSLVSLNSMANQTAVDDRVISRAVRRSYRQGTRTELLEAAGHVFAEKGFDRATGKEICERAGANSAAINYYFGGMDGLHAAVLEEANRRLVPLESVTAAIAQKTSARAKLEAIIELVVEKLLGPISSSWVLGVISREILLPTSALEHLFETQGLPKVRIAKSIIGELMGLPEDHPAVSRGCISVMAPLLLLFVADRYGLKRLFPTLSLTSNEAKVLSRHLVRFALGGLSAVTRDVRNRP